MKKVLFVTSRVEDLWAFAESARSLWSVSGVSHPKKTVELIEHYQYSAVFLELDLYGLSVVDLVDEISTLSAPPPVFILTRSLSFVFSRLFDYRIISGYFVIPYNFTALFYRVERCLVSSAQVCSDHLTASLPGSKSLLVGSSPALEAVRTQISRYGPTGESVFISGECGVGKDLVAKELHACSSVSSGEFIGFNVGCLPESLAEFMLFGSIHGAFTDSKNTPGLFEQAHNGTLFLDEIATMTKSLQPKLLRVLEDRIVTRLGTDTKKAVNFRLITASNTDMRHAVLANEFREDLFYRIDVLRIHMPPLRERLTDIPLLSDHGLLGMHKRLSDSAIDKLMSYQWPGNVRELFHCLRRAAVNAETPVIGADQIHF